MQKQLHRNGQPHERAGYFPVSGAHLYTVLHEVEDPVARVLLVGPFASERHNSYLPWVRWARFLAADNIEVLRYDYRGIGESTGIFERMTFEDWSQDVRLLAAWFATRPADHSPHVPFVLHGLGLGAVLAGRAFDEGMGDGLLLWSPPTNANQALRATLMRWVGLEQIFKFGNDRKSASDYIRELEQGSPLNVDGYRWSSSRWRESFELALPAALSTEQSAAQHYERPVKIVTLTRDAAPLTKGGLVGYDDLKDFNWLYAPNREWVAAVPLPSSPTSQSRRGAPMLEAADDRALLVLGDPGYRLQGTYHRPTGPVLDSPTSQSIRGRLGVLFVNSLSLPRAASGDSAVHWADSIAALGYPAFRIDLPGLGDSDGNASTDLLESINAGGFAAAASTAVAQLVERFGLTGMVIFGHCAGSVSALYAAATSPACKGLILLDPYFHLPRAKRHKTREGLSEWARHSRVGRLLSNSYDHLRNLRLQMRGNAPPGNANSPLLARWKQVATAGLPILLLRAPGIKTQGAKPRVGEFDYMGHVVKLAGRKNRVSVTFVENADHSFANRMGRAAVERYIADWLVLHFPLAAVSMSNDGVSPARGGKNQADARKPQTAPDDRRYALEGR